MEFSYSELLSQRKKLIGDIPLVEKSMVEVLYKEIVGYLTTNKFNYVESINELTIVTQDNKIKVDVFFDKVNFMFKLTNEKNTPNVIIDVQQVEQIVVEKSKRLQAPINSKFLPTKIIWLPEKETLDNFIKTKLYFIN